MKTVSFRKLSKNNKQVLVLYGATLIGILLGVISSVINTRFIPPSDYGDVRYIQNIINFIASLLLFGYFLSGSRLLALSNDEARSRRIRGVMVIILGITSIVLVLSCVLCYGLHLSKPNLAELFIISIPVCFNPLFLNYINTTAQGDNHIYRLSLARCLPAFLYVVLAYIIYSNYGATASRMIILQWGIPTIIYTCIIVSTKPQFVELYPIYKDLKTENKSYGFQLYIGSLVMVATNYLAGISLGVFNSDNTEVGFYTLALTITSPLATLPAIIGTTYFKQFATQPKIPTKVLYATLILMTCSCLMFILFIKPIVNLLYSEQYAQVGVYASWLALGFSIHGFGDMLNRYLGSHGKGKMIRNASITNGVFKILGFTLLVYLFNTIGAIITVIICDCVYTGVLLYYYLSFIKNNELLRSQL